MRTAVKCPIFPTPEQQSLLRSQFGQVRFVWNHMLALRERYHRMFGHRPGPMRLKKRLAVMKRRQRWAWLRESDSISLQETLRNMSKALTRACAGDAGFPRFKRRAGKQSSFHCTNISAHSAPSRNLRGNAEVRVPKIGALRMNLHREVPAHWELRSVTITLSAAGRYYASLAYEDGRAAPPKPTALRADGVIAGDAGVNVLMTMSDGTEFENPRHERRNAEKIRRLTRELARKEPGSRNREKARVRLARAHEKQANARADTAHKVSRRLIDENQVIGVEDLALAGMIRAGGGLARSLQGAGIGQVVRFLEYKAERRGRMVIRVDRFFPSSKRCRPCGHDHRGLGRGEREWDCPACGARLRRDHNAAGNIRDETLRILGAAGLAVPAA